ncbi:MAG: crotonase [Clostridiales bacterium]|nr:crotonase [Clostridiales bacterium]
MFETLKYEVKDGIAYITISRPAAMNAINTQMLDELYTAFYYVAKDPEAKVVILTGEGKAFVAGADIDQMNSIGPVEGRAMIAKGHNVMNFMESIEKPIIAAINGFALGGGCELSMACDIRIASEKAKFGQPEVGLGITPGFGGTQRLSRLVGTGMAKYLILTAQIIKADEAVRIGLVEKVTSPEELMSTCEAIANTIISKSPLAVGIAKTAINKGFNLDMSTASALEVEAFSSAFSSEDKTEGMTAFLEKRTPEFKNK